eukprot:TRINITY_DN16884_c0_g1_i1.p1 TRINITY_DN16884_c0_g1~~TRINITY_DN16884_c0_g1_i1.p1  ORF type:complete len:167 (-),score=22.91 TRINITY_DN16884_c0_g1_i1:82-582(-)
MPEKRDRITEHAQTFQCKLITFFATIAQSVAAGMNYRSARSCCLGGNIHAAYHNEGALAYLTETGTAFQPTAATMRAELVRVWPGILTFLQVPISLSGHVFSAATGQPIASTFTVPALNFNLAEVAAYTTTPFGRYHLWLPNGSWDIVSHLEMEFTEKQYTCYTRR